MCDGEGMKAFLVEVGDIKGLKAAITVHDNKPTDRKVPGLVVQNSVQR